MCESWGVDDATHKNRMECTDSNVSIDKTSKNKVSAVGAEKVSK